MESDADRIILDCKGLCCPMPIVDIGRALKKMTVGQLIEVEADDPAFKDDVMAFVRHTKHTIISLDEGSVVKVVIRKEQ